MGAIQSQSFDFYCDFAISRSYIDLIETESPNKVYHELREGCLTTYNQMKAVSIMIYKKGVLNPILSLKCAELAKKLDAEECEDDGLHFEFHFVFTEYVMNNIKTLVAKYDDSMINDITAPCGESIATFIGNLYIVDVFNLAEIRKIQEMVKQKETSKNKFFNATLMSVIAKKIQSEKMSSRDYKEVMTNGLKSVMNDSGPEVDAMTRFSKFLKLISNDEHFEFYEHFSDFKIMSEKDLEVGITTLVKDAIKLENKKLMNVYHDIALDIHYMRPNEARNCLSALLIKSIGRYEINKNLQSAENLNSCSALGRIISDLFHSGLLDEQVVEHYLNAMDQPSVPGLLFTFIFIDVLTKYRGKNIYRYLEHFKKYAQKLPDSKILIATVEEYVVDKEAEVWRDGKKIKRTGISAADLPDFREFSSNCLKTRSSLAENTTFECENRLSCHFASLRGIELLKRHIGNKFFTEDRIKVCVNMINKISKLRIKDAFNDIISREMKTYLPYFHGDIEPSIKVTNFSNLIASLYEEKMINHAVVDFWFTDIFESIKDKNHKFQDKLLEIYRKIFQRVSLQFLRDHPQAWELSFAILEAFEFKSCKFDDFDKFRNVFEIYKDDPDAAHLKKLQNVKIPDNKIALRLISRYILKLYTADEIEVCDIPQLIKAIQDEFIPSQDKNILRAELQDAICLKLGHLCASSKNTKSDSYINAENMIDLIETLCLETIMTRQGLANILNTITDLLNPNLFPVFEILNYFTLKISQFFYGAKPLPNKVEKILLQIIDNIKQSFEREKVDCSKTTNITNVYENILEDSRKKKKIADSKKQKQSKNDQNVSNDRDSSSSPPLPTSNTPDIKQDPESASSKSASISPNSNEPSTSAAAPQEQSSTDQQSTSIKPKLSPEDIKDYQDYCSYFNSIDQKSSDDDKFLLDPILISTIRITNKEQVIDFANKIIERVLAGQSTAIFFVQIAQKVGNVIQNIFKLKNQKVSFQKILIEEIFLKFEGQELLVEFICELYNNSFVNKASMIAFVDRFKSQSPQNIILMHKFVRTCAIRLSSQGDKEQLMQIRAIARTIKNLPNYDEDLKFLAQDLASSTNSLILLLENGQNKPQVMTESAEKLIDDLMKTVLKSPQIYVKSASKLDGKLKDLLIQKIEKIIKELPKFVITPDEFLNLVELVAELYNLEFLKNEFLTWMIEILMQSSTNEICSQSIEILFTKSGQKLEMANKHKFDIYMKFFEAVLAEENNTIRSESFRKIQKLWTRKWKAFKIPQNFYEDFLMLYSMKDDAKIEDIVEILNCDEEEMDKFIQVLWKIILKDPPHPSYSILCEEISKSCEAFHQKLTHFLTTRCITFIGLSTDMFNDNVKERLGKVMTFVAEIYNNNLASDEVLEMYLDQKLTSKLPTEFVTRIFSILNKCERLEKSQNDRLKTSVKNFDDIYTRGMDAQIESIIGGIKSIIAK